TLLVRVPIYGEIEKVGADAAIVQQRIPLAGRAVPDDRLAGLLGFDKKGKQFAFRSLHLLREALVLLHVGKTFRHLPRSQGFRSRAYGPGIVCRMAGIDAQRTAVSGDFLHVEEREPVCLEDLLDGKEGKVAEVLVIDRIELIEP